MSEWELLTSIVTSANNGNQAELSKLIDNSDFSGKYLAQDAAITGFELTRENIAAHKSAAIKISQFVESEKWGFRTIFRQGLLNEILNEKLN